MELCGASTKRLASPLTDIVTRLFGEEYIRNGVMTGANRPHITGKGREFFARVTMVDGLIKGVE